MCADTHPERAFEDKLKLVLTEGSVEDDYEIDENDVCGFGCSGRVIGALHRITSERVALKFLPDNEQGRMEAACLQNVQDHPGIVRLIDVYRSRLFVADDQKKGGLVLVMEALGGGELFQLIKEYGALPERQVKSVMLQVTSAIKHVHAQGLCHRDVKCENILIKRKVDVKSLSREDSSLIEVALCDFGFATNSTSPSRPVFSPYSISPEMLKSLRAQQLLKVTMPYTNKVDMWALGVLQYILMSAQPPFYSSDPNATSNLPMDMQERIAVGRCRMHIFEDYSQPARRLLQELLTVSPIRRPAAGQVMEHAWFD